MKTKGAIHENHISTNKYNLVVVGLPPLTPIKVSGLDEQLDTVDLPDGTKASGGNTKALEFSIDIPSHHILEVQSMELWYKQGQDPVQSGYKKDAVLIIKRVGIGLPRTFQLTGLFVAGRKTADLEMKGAGDMAFETWKMSADSMRPLV